MLSRLLPTNQIGIWFLNMLGGMYTLLIRSLNLNTRYSACLLGESWETLVVAAGTVFCQVELWACRGEQNNDGRVKVMHQLKGHQVKDCFIYCLFVNIEPALIHFIPFI